MQRVELEVVGDERSRTEKNENECCQCRCGYIDGGTCVAALGAVVGVGLLVPVEVGDRTSHTDAKIQQSRIRKIFNDKLDP